MMQKQSKNTIFWGQNPWREWYYFVDRQMQNYVAINYAKLINEREEYLKTYFIDLS